MTARFMIHFQTAFYAFELYDAEGNHIYDLELAIEAAEKQYGPSGWEVYNGSEGDCRFEVSA